MGPEPPCGGNASRQRATRRSTSVIRAARIRWSALTGLYLERVGARLPLGAAPREPAAEAVRTGARAARGPVSRSDADRNRSSPRLDQIGPSGVVPRASRSWRPTRRKTRSSAAPGDQSCNRLAAAYHTASLRRPPADRLRLDGRHVAAPLGRAGPCRCAASDSTHLVAVTSPWGAATYPRRRRRGL